MKKTYSTAAKFKLSKLRWALKNNLILDYSDFKETPLGSGNVSYKYKPIAPVKRIVVESGFNFS